MDIVLSHIISRQNVGGFATSFEVAMLDGLNCPSTFAKSTQIVRYDAKAYSEQVKVDQVWTQMADGTWSSIYTAPIIGTFGRRRLLQAPSTTTLRIEFSFIASNKPKSMHVNEMQELLQEQVSYASSCLRSERNLFMEATIIRVSKENPNQANTPLQLGQNVKLHSG